MTNIEIDIYPNPNNGEFVVKTTPFTGETLIEISDINGKIIFNELVKDELKPIQLTNVDDGIYFITLTNRDIKFVKRFIIQ